MGSTEERQESALSAQAAAASIRKWNNGSEKFSEKLMEFFQIACVVSYC
jgi:hypothetical protein